ncbi:efflux RND transporter periplasmic adaptor subunit [soil metagenome]
MNQMTPIDAPADFQPTVAERYRALPRWQRAALIVVPALVVVGGAVELSGRGNAAPPAPPPPMVTVATPISRDVTEWDDNVGRFAASKMVEVRPRVSGAIVAVYFRDGQIVRKGQPLFAIDARPFAAALAEAQASVASARSDLLLASSDLGRATRLTGDEGLSQGEVDSLRAKVQAAQASLAGAQARVRTRQLDVEFATVLAPITGRVSDRKVDAGNLVGAATTLLTTINALDPIYLTFDTSEAQFLKMQRANEKGVVPVDARLQDETDYRWHGRIDFADNGLDPRSGTIRGRAIFANPDYFLTPGMFGNIRLASGGGTVKALLVPDAAVQTDQVRKTLLVVGADNSVSVKPVEVGPVVDGLRVIRSGLAPGDRVIIAGMQSAMPGSKVSPTPGKIAPQAVPTAPVAAPAAAQATIAGY